MLMWRCDWGESAEIRAQKKVVDCWVWYGIQLECQHWDLLEKEEEKKLGLPLDDYVELLLDVCPEYPNSHDREFCVAFQLGCDDLDAMIIEDMAIEVLKEVPRLTGLLENEADNEFNDKPTSFSPFMWT